MAAHKCSRPCLFALIQIDWWQHMSISACLYGRVNAARVQNKCLPGKFMLHWSSLCGKFLPGVHVGGWCFLAPGDLFVFKGLEVKFKWFGGSKPAFIFAQCILAYFDATPQEFDFLVICTEFDKWCELFSHFCLCVVLFQTTIIAHNLLYYIDIISPLI